MGEERIWEGRPSSLLMLGAFAKSFFLFWLPAAIALYVLTHTYGMRPDGQDPNRIYGLVAVVWFLLPFPVLFFRWLALKSRRYELTTERLRVSTGILARRIDEMELYRVKDITLLQPFLLRIFSRGHLVLETSDKTTPSLTLEGLAGPHEVRDKLRAHVEAQRDRKRVKEVDCE